MTAKENCFILTVEDIPKKWYNILPDLPEKMPPPKDPEEGPSRLERLPKIFMKECLKQESSEDSWIDIPEPIRELFMQAGRPRPLFRAKNLEEKLKTPARLYYKSEFYSPTGSHKVNTALAQAYYAQKEGIEELSTETGAGQWGTALAYATSLVGIKLTVYWVRAVYNWKHDRRNLMQLYGADVYASPSKRTEAGRKLLEENPDHPGSLGIAVSEGMEHAIKNDDVAYSLGSVLNHVLTHQTIIGLETQQQFKMAEDYPDIIISCLGGGSNFGGFAIPFMGDMLTKGKKIQFIAAQSEVSPNLQGEYRYDFADHAEQTPLLKMYTIGHQTQMAPIRGDGLRYHGAAPIMSVMRHAGMLDTIAYPGDEKYVFDKAKMFIQTEGFLPAPESAYSIAAAIDEALKCKETGEEKAIAFNISGHGFMDMIGYREVLGLE
ncbi:MAG: TrpB-like pyridoxal phosphate-dependent enzyme [Thermoplasmata archaeon]|nr:TrpB-like pyridoxal phosphate-dependent enzyme [Thermoplasmata archaeon]